MLSSAEQTKIALIVNKSLDRAEMHWKNGGAKLLAKAAMDSLGEARAESEPSKIPGHALVQDDETVIDEFVAFVADMRESSKHLMCALSAKTADVSGLQRVYYETSALLPAIAQTISFKSGRVTEYLGDGVLALFRLDPDNKSKAIYAAHAAAKSTIDETRRIVNEVLKERYRLPSIDVGVGLACSRTLVTLVGLDGEKHPKAFGECVFRATKLSSGVNEIFTDENLQAIWPKEKGGMLRFIRKNIKGIDGYLLGKVQE